MEKLTEKRFYTNFKVASSCGGINMVLCNNIPNIDPDIFEKCGFLYDEETGEYREVFQWYITDVSDWVKEWQEKTFDINYVYSEVLDCYVMPVTHWGTPWESVPCEVFNKDWAEINKDLLEG